MNLCHTNLSVAARSKDKLRVNYNRKATSERNFGMNTIKLAEALGIDTTCSKQEIDKIRIEYGVGIDTAREMIIEPRIYQRISELVRYIYLY